MEPSAREGASPGVGDSLHLGHCLELVCPWCSRQLGDGGWAAPPASPRVSAHSRKNKGNGWEGLWVTNAMHLPLPCASLDCVQGRKASSLSQVQLVGNWVQMLPWSASKHVFRALRALRLAFPSIPFRICVDCSRGTMAGSRGMRWRLRGRSGSQLGSVSVESCSVTCLRLTAGKEKCLGTLTLRVPTMTAPSVWAVVELGISGMLLTDPVSMPPCSAPNHKC